MSASGGPPFWTPAGAARAIGGAGTWRVKPGDRDATLRGVCTDTRALEAGHAFVALRGERFDAHAFLGEALRGGAGLLIVDADAPLPVDVEADAVRAGVGVLAVSAPADHAADSGIAALHALARAWREELRDAGCTVIAVAGSNGKTTTRHLIHHVLDGARAAGRAGGQAASGTLTGSQSPRSYNNHIGVPLTLLGASADDDFVVCELGTNHPGELAPLAALAAPDVGVLTSLGREHLEHFGSVEAVAREEAALLAAIGDAAASARGVAIAHDEAWAQLGTMRLAQVRGQAVTYGESDAAVWRLVGRESAAGDAATAGAQRLTVRDPQGREHAATLALPGAHNAVNALAALAVADAMGVDVAAAAARLAHAAPVTGRMQVRDIGPLRVVDDAYNANPDSMRSALATLAEMAPPSPAGRRVAVLGDMLELGEHGPAEHRALGDALAVRGNTIGLVILIGPMAMFAAETLGRQWPAERVAVHGELAGERVADVARQVADVLRAGDIVLLKASRGVALERLLPAIEARFGQAGGGA
ncbi:MAG: UDP-N-acetylmuramoyl-tripeptide--D-alanyl-D-alanine ligase [Phycisphaeraceae bacterium]